MPFSVRNITCDHYLSPINEFNEDRLGHLKGLFPILRIFGIVEETGNFYLFSHIYIVLMVI